MNRNIFLIGFMGTGKSAVAKCLGADVNLGLEVVEMDQVIEAREGKCISDIFADEGEPYFRARETELLRELADGKNMVVSCGGGAALRAENVAEMKRGGRVVLLTASPKVILERLKDSDDRPLLAGRKDVKGISELMEQRRDRYEAAADLVIDTDGKNVQAVCEELLAGLDALERKNV